MPVETQKFIRKPLYVDAVRITAQNFDAISSWCQGEIQQDDLPDGTKSKRYIKVRVHNPKNPRQTKAFVGDWLLYTARGYKVYTPKAFHDSFDAVPAVQQEERKQQVETSPEVLEDVPPPVDRQVSHEIREAHLHSVGPVVAEPDLAAGVGEITQVEVEHQAEDGRFGESHVASDEGVPEPEETGVASKVLLDVGGTRVLSLAEQHEMTPEEVRELIQSGEAVLEQDVTLPNAS